ncbi:MAG TPA: hypothetical protein VFN42_02440 [Acetobacteraceae bacterium]|nr:hypothetical protein [Acetobacteraceae bacterium]
MSASIQSAPLPTQLRALRVGMDDSLHIRRTVQLAAAKIEDLEDQVARLAEELRRSAGFPGNARRAKRDMRPPRLS